MFELSAVKKTGEYQIHVSDGLSQSARHLPALHKDYFNVNEMRFEQLLTQMQDYAQLVNMPDLHNKTATADFFAADEIIIMAQILSIDLANLDHHFERRLQQELGNNEWLWAEKKGAVPLGLARLLDSWLVLLRYPQSDAGENLYSMIESVVISFGKEFFPLINQTPLGDKLHYLFSPSFIALIHRESLLLENAVIKSPVTKNVGHERNFEQDIADTKSVYASLLKAIEMIQQTARKLLPQSMHAEYHDPGAALRIAFVHLYQKLQHKLNHFTLDYIDFYFNDVLKATARPLKPDSVYLVVQPNVQQKIIHLPQGTEFLAGIDVNSADIIYRSNMAAEINDAQVVNLHTLYFPYHGIAEDSTQKLIDACWLNTIPVKSANSEHASSTESYYPLFGEQRSQHKSESTIDGRLGFALASNVLLMREGKRRVTVHLQYAHLNAEGCSSLEKKIALMPPLKQSKIDKRAKNKENFFAYFSNIFKISLTTAEGWFEIPEYKPAYYETDSSIKKNCLSITFYLPEQCPAITPFSASVHGNGQPTSVPVLRFLLSHNHQQYPYDLLKEFVLKDVKIAVDVEGCRDLVLYNDLGQLSPLSPFMPFGPLPTVGSYFIVGHEETRTKQLTSFDVDIEWKGLPDINMGFNGWYEGYSVNKTNDKFVVSASVLSDGKWQPRDSSSPQQQLFSIRAKNGKQYLSIYKRLFTSDVMAYYKPQNSTEARKPFVYTPSSKSGLFKFILKGPLGAFGHAEYQQLMTSTLTYNARVKNSKLFKSIPNTPYTPEISAISVNYSAVSLMTLGDSERQQNGAYKDQFFHLHPLGWEKISPLNHPRVFQVPQYKDVGSLYIGLTASYMHQLNLLFHFHNDSLPMEPMEDEAAQDKGFHKAVDSHVAISWSYLSNNQWRALQPKQILADSTHGFMRSGVITLELPDDFTANNTLMPTGIYWLRISANHQLKNFSHLYSVYTQALCATWSAGLHPPTKPPMTLPANTIKRTRQTIPGIAGVIQICPSFGGIPTETTKHLRTRMSERLRHKNRTLTPRDYELLILENFPQIYKVKCFANINTRADQPLQPGHLLVVPIPHVSSSKPSFYQPHFDGYLIASIKEFIHRLASPFIKVSVENPVYEEIQVRCAVQFKKDMHPGHYHNKLNTALCDFISPWIPLGNNIHFGWRISAQDIKSFIHNLDYVDFVTDFSLLRIAPHAQGLYFLNDTASDVQTKSDTISPTYLWSIAVPIQHHFIESTSSRTPIIAEITGYDELEVGSTFIIS